MYARMHVGGCFWRKRDEKLLGGLYGFSQVASHPSSVISKKGKTQKSSLTD